MRASETGAGARRAARPARRRDSVGAGGTAAGLRRAIRRSRSGCSSTRRTTEFRHLSIATGIETIRELGEAGGFEVDATEDPALFNPREPEALRRRPLPQHHRHRARDRRQGRAAEVRPRRRRVRRHPLRRRHRAQVALLRPSRRRLLPQPSARAVRDDRQRGSVEPGDRAPAPSASPSSTSSIRSRRTRAPTSRCCSRSTSRPTSPTRTPPTSRAGRRRPATWAITRCRGVTTTSAAGSSTPRSATRRYLYDQPWYREHILQGILLAAGRVEGKLHGRARRRGRGPGRREAGDVRRASDRSAAGALPRA